ncbi:MAG: dTMP kinase [Fibrobacter sp.]|nr:dTMP kinase [Fibrobacter sp.]
MSRGLFFTFEGIDGCGKSTQVKETVQWLESRGLPVTVTREPGGTVISEKIRQILISEEHGEMVNECELLLYLAARAQHVREKIYPLLQKGNIVICDRFQEATFAYQGFGRNIEIDFLKQMNSFATCGLIPDLSFVIDLDVELSFKRIERMKRKKDRIELGGKEFFGKIREGYRKLALMDPKRIKVLDGNLPISELTGHIREEIEKNMRINEYIG